MNLKQGANSVADYSVGFWTLAADSKWNEDVLQGAFLNGLNEVVKDELAVRDEPNDLNGLVSLAIKIDNRFWERSSRPSSTGQVPIPSTFRTTSPLLRCPTPPVPARRVENEAMQLGCAGLSPAE